MIMMIGRAAALPITMPALVAVLAAAVVVVQPRRRQGR
jgi:hypothetical protein